MEYSSRLRCGKLNLFLVHVAAEVSCWMCTGERQAGRIRAKYLRAILRQDVAYFERGQGSTAEVVNNVSADTLLVQEAMSEKVSFDHREPILVPTPIFCVKP